MTTAIHRAVTEELDLINNDDRELPNRLRQVFDELGEERLLQLARRIVSASLPVAEGVEAYPLNAHLWKRDSTSEWVLSLSGVINDTDFTIRHAQPGDLMPEIAVGLPTHYDLMNAAEGVAKVLDLVEDIPDVVYVPSNDITSDEIRGPTARALRHMLAANARANAARLNPNGDDT